VIATGSHLRERSLTVLVIIEAIELFVLAPLSATNGASFLLVGSIIVANVAAVLAVVWHIRAAVIAVVLATATETAAVVLRFVEPSQRTEALDFAAALTLLVALTVVLGVAVFGPGRVTIHRILGAIAIYLNVAAAFALAYRVIATFGPGRFSPTPAVSPSHAIADFVYFSFTTLTTTGFGDIVPVDPFARSIANVESVIGQLFPATLLARLITLELEHRRELP
jgi:Ion channel